MLVHGEWIYVVPITLIVKCIAYICELVIDVFSSLRYIMEFEDDDWAGSTCEKFTSTLEDEGLRPFDIHFDEPDLVEEINAEVIQDDRVDGDKPLSIMPPVGAHHGFINGVSTHIAIGIELGSAGFIGDRSLNDLDVGIFGHALGHRCDIVGMRLEGEDAFELVSHHHGKRAGMRSNVESNTGLAIGKRLNEAINEAFVHTGLHHP